MTLDELEKAFHGWRLDRVELAFFHACDNRWELYQATPTGKDGITDRLGRDHPETYFKRQIGGLLKAVEAAVSTVFDKEIVRMADQAPEANGNTRSLEVDFGMIEVDLGKIERRIRDGCSQFCMEQLQFDQVPISAEIQKLLTAIKEGKPVTAEPTKEEIADVVAAMPIARMWDVFGQLHPMSTSSTALEPRAAWNQLVVYRVTQRLNRDEEKAQSVKGIIPERRIRLQMFSRLARREYDSDTTGAANRLEPDELQQLVERDLDFFAVCRPTNKREGPMAEWQDMNEPEKMLYRVYGQFIDAVQALQAVDGSHKPTITIEQPTTTFYVLIPVIACGYNHFIQLILSKPNSRDVFAKALCYCFVSLAIHQAISRLNVTGNSAGSMRRSGRARFAEWREAILSEWAAELGPELWRGFSEKVHASHALALALGGTEGINRYLSDIKDLVIRNLNHLHDPTSARTLQQHLLPRDDLAFENLLRPRACYSKRDGDDHDDLDATVNSVLVKYLFALVETPLKRRNIVPKHRILKESVRELLVQIRVSAFQSYVERWLIQHARDISASVSPQSIINECFCELSPHLNEMRAAYTTDYVWYHFPASVKQDALKISRSNTAKKRRRITAPDPLAMVKDILDPWTKLPAEMVCYDGTKKTFVACRDGDISVRELLKRIPVEERTQWVIGDWIPCYLDRGEVTICLYHHTGDEFDQVCFRQTNTMRLREQYEWLSHKVREFWYKSRP